MNDFRIIADISHLLAMIVLVVKIVKTKSVSGLSGISQVFYALVFTTRYLDLFTGYYSGLYYLLMKCMFIVVTYLTVVLIYCTFKNSYNHKKDTRWTLLLLIPVTACALLINRYFSFMEVAWAFSIYLEAVAMIPQIVMIYRIGECEVVTMHYVFVLGLYRPVHVAYWVYSYPSYYSVISLVGGLVQTLVYCPFFYLYFTKVDKGNMYKLKGYSQVDQNDCQEAKTELMPGSGSKMEDEIDQKVDVVVKIEIDSDKNVISI